MTTRGVRRIAALWLGGVLLAGCSTTFESLPPSSASVGPTQSPASGIAQATQPPACDPRTIGVTAGGWGGAAGTEYVVLDVSIGSGEPCLIPASPAVQLLDGAGRVIAFGPDGADGQVLDTGSIDLRLGWSSWCSAAPAGPLRARLAIGAAGVEATLPSGFLASCQGAPTVVYVEPVLPVGT